MYSKQTTRTILNFVDDGVLNPDIILEELLYFLDDVTVNSFYSAVVEPRVEDHFDDFVVQGEPMTDEEWDAFVTEAELELDDAFDNSILGQIGGESESY